MSTEPTIESTARTGARTVAVRLRLVAVAAAAAAVAVVPAGQALASSHDRPPAPPSASRGGDHDGRPRTTPTDDPAGNSQRGGTGRQTGRTAGDPPCGRVDERPWWPFGNAVHGTEVVQTRDGGLQALTFQRGIVQAATDTTVTVKSLDDVTANWTFSDSTAIWRFGRRGAGTDLAPGQCVGIWGTGPAQTPTARFVVIRWAPGTPPSSTPSGTPTVTPSSTPTVTPSSTPTVTPSSTPTVTPSSTPTVSPTV